MDVTQTVTIKWNYGVHCSNYQEISQNKGTLSMIVIVWINLDRSSYSQIIDSATTIAIQVFEVFLVSVPQQGIM